LLLEREREREREERESFLLSKRENEVTVIRRLAALQPLRVLPVKPFVGKNITPTEFPCRFEYLKRLRRLHAFVKEEA
jgi:hypothetical protein